MKAHAGLTRASHPKSPTDFTGLIYRLLHPLAAAWIKTLSRHLPVLCVPRIPTKSYLYLLLKT